MKFLVPKECPCCGSPYTGGSQLPGRPFKVGFGEVKVAPWIVFKGPRVWYECGASMCISEEIEFGLEVRLQGCNCGECREADDKAIKRYRRRK